MRRSRGVLRRKRWAAFALLLGAGCGGKVIFDTGATSTTGAGGSSNSAECVLGVCNDPCTKCVGSSCFTGKCDATLKCQPPGTTIMCTK